MKLQLQYWGPFPLQSTLKEFLFSSDSSNSSTIYKTELVILFNYHQVPRYDENRSLHKLRWESQSSQPFIRLSLRIIVFTQKYLSIAIKCWDTHENRPQYIHILLHHGEVRECSITSNSVYSLCGIPYQNGIDPHKLNCGFFNDLYHFVANCSPASIYTCLGCQWTVTE